MGESKVPTTKVTAAGVAIAPAIAVAMIVKWLLSLVGIDMPDEILLAISTVLPVVAAYVIKERNGKDTGGRHAADG